MLRSLIPLLFSLSLPSLGLSDEIVGQETPPVEVLNGEDTQVPEFREGAQGDVQVDVPGLLARIEELKVDILGHLDIQVPMELEGIDPEALVSEALNYGPVHELLKVGPEYAAPQEADERYNGTFGFVFLSFSMPEKSLQQSMQEAEALGVTVVFRGFVNESVAETQAALERIFLGAEASPGFIIDPTLFEKFEIQHVPSVVVLPKETALCISDACFDQLMPPHDRVDGNIPIRAALRIITHGGGEAAIEAGKILSQ